MLNQFSRTELLFGKAAMEKLENSRVAVFGIGGVGGYVCEALVRSGVGHFDLIDDDKVCLTNLNRQIIATRKTVGQYKTDVMKERMLDINPKVDVTVHKCFFLPENAGEFHFEQYDYVVDAVDTVTGKNFPGHESPGGGNSRHQLYGRRKQAGSQPFSGSGYLQDQGLPTGKGHAPGTEKKRCPEAESRLFR